MPTERSRITMVHAQVKVTEKVTNRMTVCCYKPDGKDVLIFLFKR